MLPRRLSHKKIPDGFAVRELSLQHGYPVGGRQQLGEMTPSQTCRPTEYRCYIKEVFLICNSGCGDPIVERSFVLQATPRPGGT